MKSQAGIDKVKEAISIRAHITETYKRYEKLSKIVQTTSGCTHSDFKRAVDAMYYLGGGWPSQESKGRMEALLDNFVGMYKVLRLAGKGHYVEEHLANHGMTITLTNEIPDYEFTSADQQYLKTQYAADSFELAYDKLSSLVSSAISSACDMQSIICKEADIIKHDLKPGAMQDFGVENFEYDRIHKIMQADEAKAHKNKTLNDQSIANYREAIKHIKR